MEVTPPSVAPSSMLSALDTPLGDHERRPKVQLCFELRDKKTTNSKKIKTRKVLEVTVMWVKNLPQTNGNRPNPFVKLQLSPSDVIFTTELKSEKVDAQFIEIFEFPVESDDLKDVLLKIEVCNRKPTRNAKCFGDISIPLDNIKISNPVCKWFYLNLSENEEIDSLKLANKRKKA